jgi:hypothetical protein
MLVLLVTDESEMGRNDLRFSSAGQLCPYDRYKLLVHRVGSDIWSQSVV